MNKILFFISFFCISIIATAQGLANSQSFTLPVVVAPIQAEVLRADVQTQSNLNSAASTLVTFQAPYTNGITGATVTAGNTFNLPSGGYELISQVYFQVAANGPQRPNLELKYNISTDGANWTNAGSYIRRASGHNEGGGNAFIYYFETATPCTIQLTGRQIAAAGIVSTVTGNGGIIIKRLAQ